MKPGFETPILLLCYNRHNHIKVTLEILRKIRPLYLYLAVEGPLLNLRGDYEKCCATRDLLVNEIDWPCCLEIKASPTYQGYASAVIAGISWFFEHVDEGIILDEGTYPSEELFSFCPEVLRKYRNTSEIFCVNGSNFLDGWGQIAQSYYFSKYYSLIGGATWKRSWKFFDPAMKGLSEFLGSPLMNHLFPNPMEAKYWTQLLLQAQQNPGSFWDIAFFYAGWKSGALAINPSVNLVTIQDYRHDSNDLLTKNPATLGLPTLVLGEVTHTSNLEANSDADLQTFKSVYFQYH